MLSRGLGFYRSESLAASRSMAASVARCCVNLTIIKPRGVMDGSIGSSQAAGVRMASTITSLPAASRPLNKNQAIAVPTRAFVKSTRPSLQQAGSAPRVYRYYVDIHGRLFLEDTWPRTIATSLKDVNFLNMFYRKLRRNDRDANSVEQYPFLSPCGRELNFVSCAATPVVFSKLENGRLHYAGNLSVPFEPEKLQVCSRGWLYHPAPVGDVGLICSALAQQWVEQAEEDQFGRLVVNAHDKDAEGNSAEEFVLPARTSVQARQTPTGTNAALA